MAKLLGERVSHRPVYRLGYCIVLHGNFQSAQNTAPRLFDRSDRARHGGFIVLSTAMGTLAAAIAAGAVFAA